MRVLAFDTSNYTTSVASFDGTEGHNISRLLDVEQGALGLRQSDALFAHVKRLPELADRLFSDIGTDAGFEAVGVSTRPRAVEGSYMPCFLAGESQARVLGAALGVPVLPFSHQQGHIAASLWGSGHMELMDEPHLAWHLSGGTTELLRVTPEGKGSVHAEKIGGTTDISAGQLIDRTGKLLGLRLCAKVCTDCFVINAGCFFTTFFAAELCNICFIRYKALLCQHCRTIYIFQQRKASLCTHLGVGTFHQLLLIVFQIINVSDSPAPTQRCSCSLHSFGKQLRKVKAFLMPSPARHCRIALKAGCSGAICS